MNFECGTQCQIPPQYRCNGFTNTNANCNALFPLQNIGTNPAAVSPGIYPVQNSTATQIQNVVPNCAPNIQSNVQFVLCLDHTVFHPDRFEVYIDARGFSPTDVKINITRERVEVLADKVLPPINNTLTQFSQKRLILSRIYTLPQPVVPEMGICAFKDECLSIAAPWARQ